ncbi:hypothetical protein BDW75DRAFT_233407 [Aspergillus navahoensis]
MGPLIAKVLEGDCELCKERAACHRAEDELNGMKELINILLHQQRATLESILDLALAQLELQKQNDQLRTSNNLQFEK